MRRFFFLSIFLNALLFISPPPIIADAVPDHLVSMTVDLLKATKKDLTADSRPGKPGNGFGRAYKILKQEGLFHWGRKSLIQKGMASEIAAALGIGPVGSADIPKLQQFLDTQRGGRMDAAIDELFTAYGRKRPVGEAREKSTHALDKLWDTTWGSLSKRYTLEGIRGPHRIALYWEFENARFSIQIMEDYDATPDSTQTRIEGDVRFTVDPGGQDLEICVIPTADPIRMMSQKAVAPKQDDTPRRNVTDKREKSALSEDNRQVSPTEGKGRAENIAQKRPDQEKAPSKVYVWKNPETGEVVRQTRFKRLKDPFEYEGEFAEEALKDSTDPGAAQPSEMRPTPAAPSDTQDHSATREETWRRGQTSTTESTARQQGSRGSIISLEKELYFHDEPFIVRYRVPEKPDYSLSSERLDRDGHRTTWNQLYSDNDTLKFWLELEWGGFSDYGFYVHSFYPKTPVSTDYIRIIRRERLLPNAIKIMGGERQSYGTGIVVDVDVPRDMMLAPQDSYPEGSARKRDFYFDVVSVGQSVCGGAVIPEQIIAEQQITQTHTRFELHDYKTRWGGMREPGSLNPSSGYGIEPGLYELRLQTHDGYIVDRTPLLVTVDEMPEKLHLATSEKPEVGEEIKVIFDAPQPVNSFFYYGIECVRLTEDLASERLYIKDGLKPGEPFFAGRAVQGGNYEIRLFIQNKYMKTRYVIDTLDLHIGGKPPTAKGFFISIANLPMFGSAMAEIILPQGEKIPVELFLEGKVGMPAPKMMARLFRKDERTERFSPDTVASIKLIHEWPLDTGRKSAWTIDGNLEPGLYELRISYVFEGFNAPQSAQSTPAFSYSLLILPFHKFNLSLASRNRFQLGETIPVSVLQPDIPATRFLNLGLRMKKIGGRVPGCAIETFEPKIIPLDGRRVHEIHPDNGLGAYELQLVHIRRGALSLGEPLVFYKTAFEVVSSPIPNALSISGRSSFSPKDDIRSLVHIPVGHPFRDANQNPTIEPTVGIIRHGIVTIGNGIRSAQTVGKQTLDLNTGEAAVDMNVTAQGSYEVRLWDRISGILLGRAPFIVRDSRSPFPLDHGLRRISTEDDLEFEGNPWPAVGEYLDDDQCQILRPDVKLVSAVVAVLPVEFDENRIANVFEVIIASKLYDETEPKSYVKLKVNFHAKPPGDDSEVIMVASDLSTVLSEEPLNIQAKNIYNNPRPTQRNAVTSNRFVGTPDNYFTHSDTNALACSFSQYVHSNNQQRFTSVRNNGFTVMNASLHNNTILTTGTYPKPFVRPIQNEIHHANNESDQKSARTNSDGVIFTKIRLRANEAGNILTLHHEIDDPEFLEENGLTGHAGAASPSSALLGDIEEKANGITSGILSSVIAKVGTLLHPAQKGFITNILPDKNDLFKWVIDRFLDALLETDEGKALNLVIKDVFGGSDQDSRAAMLGISFGIPNGMYAFGEGEWEDLRFVFYDGWVMLIDWLALDRRSSISAGVMFERAASGDFEAATALFFEQPTIKRIQYVLSPDFKTAVAMKMIPILARLKMAEGEIRLFLIGKLCQGVYFGWKEIMPGVQEIATVFDLLFPNYSKTIGGDLAINVMGYQKYPNQYAYNAFGYTAGFLSGYISGELVENIGLAAISDGAGNLGRWFIKLGVKSAKIKNLLATFMKMLRTIPYVNRVNGVKTFWAVATILEKIEDTQKAVKLIEAFDGPEFSKLGSLIFKHIDKYPDNTDGVIAALANVTKAVDKDIAGDTIKALARITDEAGHGVTMTLDQLETVGKAIGKLKKKFKEPGNSFNLDVDGDFLGIDSQTGNRIKGHGFSDIPKAFSRLEGLSEGGIDNFLKLVSRSKADSSSADAIRAAEEVLSRVTDNHRLERMLGNDDIFSMVQLDGMLKLVDDVALADYLLKIGHWGILPNGRHQGFAHFFIYWEIKPKRIPSIARRLGIDVSDFIKNEVGYRNFTEQVLRVKKEAMRTPDCVRVHGDKTIYFMYGVKKPKEGVAVVEYKGKLQSIMQMTPTNFRNKDWSKSN